MLHKRYEYRGVIFGMDPVCRADESWIRVRVCHPFDLGSIRGTACLPTHMM